MQDNESILTTRVVQESVEVVFESLEVGGKPLIVLDVFSDLSHAIPKHQLHHPISNLETPQLSKLLLTF